MPINALQCLYFSQSVSILPTRILDGYPPTWRGLWHFDEVELPLCVIFPIFLHTSPPTHTKKTLWKITVFATDWSKTKKGSRTNAGEWLDYVQVRKDDSMWYTANWQETWHTGQQIQPVYHVFLELKWFFF